MKKILILIIVFSFLVGTVGITLAQSEPSECCKVTQKIEGVGDTISGTVADPKYVGPDTVVFCDKNGDGVQQSGETPDTPRSDWGLICMLNTIYTVTNWVFYILTLLAILFIIYGGFTVLTSAGDPTKATKGKSILTYAIIGLAVALLAKFVPSLVKFILGM